MIRNIFTKVSFYYLSKGLDVLATGDDAVKRVLDIMPVGCVIKLDILGSKQCLVIQKCEQGFCLLKTAKQIDLTITFKNFNSLTSIVFGKSSVTDCYLQDDFVVCGELRYAVAMVYAFEKFISYILSKKRFYKVYHRQAVKTITTSKMYAKLIFAKRRKENEILSIC